MDTIKFKLTGSGLWSLSCVGHTKWYSHTLLHEKAKPSGRHTKTDLLELAQILSTEGQTYIIHHQYASFLLGNK